MDALFFWASKLLWLLIKPESLLLIAFSAGFLLLWLCKTEIAKRILGGVLVAMLMIGFFPLGEWLLYPLESRYPHNVEPEQVDGIVALSGALDPMGTKVWDQVVAGGAAERNFAFVRLANKYPDARLVYTGGASSMTYQQYKAADAAKRLYAELGLDIDRILFERESRNTAESAVNVKRLVNPKLDEKWMLLTTGWHMPRSVGVFCKVGWQVIPYPVDFQTKPGHLLRIGWDFADHMRDLNTAVKEWVGLFAYALLGRSC